MWLATQRELHINKIATNNKFDENDCNKDLADFTPLPSIPPNIYTPVKGNNYNITPPLPLFQSRFPLRKQRILKIW